MSFWDDINPVKQIENVVKNPLSGLNPLKPIKDTVNNVNQGVHVVAGAINQPKKKGIFGSGIGPNFGPGLVPSITDAIKDPIGTIGNQSNPFTAIPDAVNQGIHAVGDILGTNKPENGSGPAGPPPPPGPDPRQTEIQDQQRKAAEGYRANLAGTQEQIFGGIESQARRSLAKRLHDTNVGYNHNGLLYSGLRQGAISGDKANTAAGLAQIRAGINSDTNAQADAMDSNVIRTSLGLQNQNVMTQDQIYQQALQNAQNRLGLFNAVGGLAGNVIGTFAQNRNTGGG